MKVTIHLSRRTSLVAEAMNIITGLINASIVHLGSKQFRVGDTLTDAEVDRLIEGSASNVTVNIKDDPRNDR